jgi:hypothetical protein
MNEPKSYDGRLQGPATIQLSGATSSGKTWMCREIIRAADELITPKVQRYLYAYGEYQKFFDSFPPYVEFHRGIDEDLISRENLKDEHTLLVIDDLLDEADSTLLSNIFTKFSHHRNITVLLLSNSLFSKQKNYRLLAVNTQYYFIFRSARDHSSVATLARQMFGSAYKYMVAAYQECIKKDYGYLFLDLKANTPPALRVRTNILPHETTTVFLIKDNGQKR